MQAAITTADQSSRQRLLHLAMFGLVVAYAALLVMTFLMGIWLVDPEGQPVATDFVSFWAAGKLVLQGHPADAYDWTIHKAVAVESGLDFKGYFTFQYPPIFLMITPALALIPYPAALVAWMAVGLPLYLCAIRLITGTWNATLAALAWPAVLWNMVLGQNGFLTAALLGAGIALIEKRPALSGILFGLLTCKPQFGLLIPVALIAGGHWRVIGWAALSTAALVAVSTAVLGTDSWAAFVGSAFRINEAILVEGGTDFSELQSVYGYVRALGGSSAIAWTAHGLLVALLAAGVIWIWRKDTAFDIKAAALAVRDDPRFALCLHLRFRGARHSAGVSRADRLFRQGNRRDHPGRRAGRVGHRRSSGHGADGRSACAWHCDRASSIASRWRYGRRPP